MKKRGGRMEYEVRRSKRRTLVITVSEGKVLVKAPLGLSDAAIGSLLESKRSWIEKKLQAQTDPKFSSVREGLKILDAGAVKVVVFGTEKNFETADTFYLKDKTAVRKYFERTRGWILKEVLFELTKMTGTVPQSVGLHDFKARWGSCDTAGNIKLNWRLSMLPPRLRDYVLIHELCHLKEMNHSAAFWRLVGRYCPQYRELRKELKEYSFLTLLYRSGGQAG